MKRKSDTNLRFNNEYSLVNIACSGDSFGIFKLKSIKNIPRNSSFVFKKRKYFKNFFF